MISWLANIIAFATSGVWYLYITLRWHRYDRYKDLPTPPTNLILGHLKELGKAMNKVYQEGGPNCHPGKKPAFRYPRMCRSHHSQYMDLISSTTSFPPIVEQ
jgi:hypothetical protein